MSKSKKDKMAHIQYEQANKAAAENSIITNKITNPQANSDFRISGENILVADSLKGNPGAMKRAGTIATSVIDHRHPNMHPGQEMSHKNPVDDTLDLNFDPGLEQQFSKDLGRPVRSSQ